MVTNIVLALLVTQSSSPTTPVSTLTEAQICAEAMQGMSANPPIPYGVT
jgi:hypothetical protein